jgi:hypothetical protein
LAPIPPGYPAAQSDDVDCLVLELVEGDTLRGPMPTERALDYSRQIVDALEAAQPRTRLLICEAK